MNDGVTHALGGNDFAAPTTDRWLEDYHPGACYEYGYRTVTEAEIVEFATRFDPQPLHLDPATAATGPFEGLIASGWHTAAMLSRLFVDHFQSHVATLGSPGLDELRWTTPVRPGDTLRLRATVETTRPSHGKPDRGVVGTRAELINQHDRAVLTLLAWNILARRPG